MNDLVIKFLTVRIDEKTEAHRKAQEAARKARGAQAAEAGSSGHGNAFAAR